MNYQILGKKTGLPVSEFALGTAMFGQTWGYGADAAEVERIIDLYTDHCECWTMRLTNIQTFYITLNFSENEHYNI